MAAAVQKCVRTYLAHRMLTLIAMVFAPRFVRAEHLFLYLWNETSATLHCKVLVTSGSTYCPLALNLCTGTCSRSYPTMCLISVPRKIYQHFNIAAKFGP